MTPQTPEELAEALGCATASGHSIRLGGGFTKDGMAGPVADADVTISTAALNGILKYEPGDLTISVGAGMRYAELSRAIAEHGQMLPLDPPFSAEATIGGMLGANTSGPRRRLYGTARDFVIGMRCATLEGKLVETGGMVVKNVAGLDIAKLMIGSFGTLAAIASANFKLAPRPPRSRTFVLGCASVDEAIIARDRILAGVLQPAAIDLLNAAAASEVGCDGHSLIVQAAGSDAVIERYTRELPGARIFDGADEAALFAGVQEFTPRFLARHAEAAVVRVSCLLSEIGQVVRAADGPAVARAGSGVVYLYLPDCGAAADTARRFPRGVIEFAPAREKAGLELWPMPGNDLEMLRRIKQLFDPQNLLNRGRLYGRI